MIGSWDGRTMICWCDAYKTDSYDKYCTMSFMKTKECMRCQKESVYHNRGKSLRLADKHEARARSGTVVPLEKEEEL